MSIKFKKIDKEIQEIISKFNSINLENKEALFLRDEFNEKLRELKDKTKLEIAFVGQYSAGKSTIISALTNNKNIKIGQDVTTDKPQAYKWGTVLVVDTPGIYAGREDHDKVSIEYMNRADLLVYVITTEGFSDTIAKNFKKLAFEENRIDKMMLVINKSSQGDKEVEAKNWILDALKVIQPKTEKDLFLSIIDANDYIEAFNYEEEDRKALIEYSNFLEFEDNLNKFISQKGILGKLVTPLNLTQEYIHKIINTLSTKDKDRKNLLELLSRKQKRLQDSKNKMVNLIEDNIDTLYYTIKQKGDDIAFIITQGKEKIEKESEEKEKEIKEEIRKIETKISENIQKELLYLEEELKNLTTTPIALSLNKSNLKIEFNKDIQLNQFDSQSFTKVSEVINGIGEFSTKFATNPEASKLGLEGLKKVAGSDAHKTVYEVGKFFGKNFKPYEAVKMADKIGKVGTFLSKISVFLPLITAGIEEYQERKYEKELLEAKNEVRKSYAEVANEVRNNFLKQFNKFLEETYNYEIENTTQLLNIVREEDETNKKEIKELKELLENLSIILKEVERSE